MSGEGSARLSGRRADSSLATRLARAYHGVLAGIAVTALITLAVFAVVGFGVLPRVHRYVNGARSVRDAQLAMIDQETGIRGFLLTGDEKFLQPYRAGARALSGANAAAVHELGGERVLARPLLDMRLAQQAWSDQWAAVAVNGRAPAPGTPQFDTFIASGKTLFDTFRARTTEVLRQVDGKRDAALHQEGTVLGVGIGLDVVVLLVLTLLAVRQFQRVRDVVVQPVAELVAAVARLGGGDYDVHLPSAAPEELSRIGDGLIDAAATLRAAQELEQTRQDELERQSEKLTRILSMSREIAGSLNLRYVLQAVGASAVSVGKYIRVRVWVLDEKQEELRVAHRTDGAAGAETVPIGGGLVGQAAKYGRALGEAADGLFHPASDTSSPVLLLALPMVVGARVVGVLECENDQPLPLSGEDLDVLETLSSHAATAIEAARLHGETAALSQTDALTRLFNRRRLDDDLMTETYRCQRYGRPLALIMLDVDHFKTFNDTHGHQRGDEVLEELGKVLTGVIRASDTAYRYGGEEFTVLCREASLQGGADLAERLRARLEQRLATDGVTASFGVAAVPGDGTDPATLVAAADRALYAAKRAGRNRVVTSTTAAADATQS